MLALSIWARRATQPGASRVQPRVNWAIPGAIGLGKSLKPFFLAAARRPFSSALATLTGAPSALRKSVLWAPTVDASPIQPTSSTLHPMVRFNMRFSLFTFLLAHHSLYHSRDAFAEDSSDDPRCQLCNLSDSRCVLARLSSSLPHGRVGVK